MRLRWAALLLPALALVSYVQVACFGGVDDPTASDSDDVYGRRCGYGYGPGAGYRCYGYGYPGYGYGYGYPGYGYGYGHP